ncbi:cytosolic arginine sensor for mTORC1 subunit 1 isoform X1 [Monodon monoceros]|uniref:cytosolic arginine sensor for mTORC1 subunit 1 isoform X1 n=1 Tax=Monodon monoceros TaxID=40151 RepID=UPI0010F50330|nr:cytosolic arginine sensor for mTORC1 subunit 1 isoform X1 [Monodon monoceros]
MVRLGLEPSSVWIWSSDLNWEVTIPDRPTPEAPLSPCRHAGLRSRTWGRKTAPVSRPDLTLVELSKAQTGKLRAGSSPVGPDWACAPCPTELPSSEFLQVAEATWLVLNVSSHSGAAVQAAGVTKIARSVIAPLAEHHVSVLMLSTYQTDFILVREQDLSVVIHTLAQEFDIYREVGGEPVPVARDDSSNGFPRAQHGPSPTVHPIQSPENRFCVLTLDPETLPAIATTLIDVLFYSHSPPKEAASGGPGSSSITFFAFSLIEGYISIVMDAETQKKFPSDLLLTSSSGELWRMVRIGGQPLGFDECGIVAQIAGPLAAADISAYYISTFNFDHALVPEDGIGSVIKVLQHRQEGLGS